MLQYIFNSLSAPEYLNTVYARTFIGFFIAIIASLCCGGRVIAFLRAHQAKGQPIREDGPMTHLLTKKGTPTMGGLLILGSIFFAVLLCADLTNPLVWIALLVLLVYGFVGFVDDYVKVTKNTANAMSVKMKLFLQFTTAVVAVLVVMSQLPEDYRFLVTIPYLPFDMIDLSWLYVPFAMVVIVGSSNAVNLSDGLDGLAAGLLIAAFAVYLVIAYICGGDMAAQLYILDIPQAAEIAVVCAAVIGACAGFLWFNAAPAKVFMGDTGSLALGALLGTVAVMVKHEVLLAIVGGVFVAEAVSVMIQVYYFRVSGGKRFFKMAPIHHHFEQLGWPETRVVIRFWIIAFVLAVLGLLTLQFK